MGFKVGSFDFLNPIWLVKPMKYGYRHEIQIQYDPDMETCQNQNSILRHEDATTQIYMCLCM